MSDRPPLTTTDQVLAAFADGELDAAQQLTVLKHVAAHPVTAKRVEREVKLRDHVSRVMKETPETSILLRNRINVMADEWEAEEKKAESAVKSAAPAAMQISGTEKSRSSGRWFIGRALPIAAAASIAFLLLGLWAGRQYFAAPDTGGRLASSPVPASFIAAATRTHVDCSRMQHIHIGSWPQALGDLGPPLLKYLGRPVPYPDLSPIGYAYVGAGPCDKPMENSAHILYRSMKGPATDTVSLFVQKDDANKVPVKEGTVYRATSKESAHPMFVWRHGNMVFYLLGDAEEPVEKAAAAMHIAIPA